MLISFLRLFAGFRAMEARVRALEELVRFVDIRQDSITEEEYSRIAALKMELGMEKPCVEPVQSRPATLSETLAFTEWANRH